MVFPMGRVTFYLSTDTEYVLRDLEGFCGVGVGSRNPSVCILGSRLGFGRLLHVIKRRCFRPGAEHVRPEACVHGPTVDASPGRS